MSPLKKRQRLMAEQQSKAQAAAAAAASTEQPTLESINALFAELATRTSDPEFIRTSLWKLADWQRHLYETLAQQETKLSRLTADRIQAQRKEQAESYERSHLQRQIETLRQFATPNLEQLAREETGAISSKNQAAAVSSEQVLQQFLEADPNNPSHKSFIVSKLQECLQQRAALEKVVEAKRKALQLTQTKLKQQQDFLQALPKHVHTIRRASTALSKFMEQQSQSVATTRRLRRST